MRPAKAATIALDLATMEHPVFDRFMEWILSPRRVDARLLRRAKRRTRRDARRQARGR